MMRIVSWTLVLSLVQLLQSQTIQITAAFIGSTGSWSSTGTIIRPGTKVWNVRTSMKMVGETDPVSTEDEMVPVSSRRNYLSKMATTAFGVASFGGLSTIISTTNAAAVDDLTVGGKIVYGSEAIMSPKEHGTSTQPVQENLLYGVSNKLADKICNYNRHFAEYSGYAFQSSISFQDTVLQASGPITFYDSVTGKPLFVAPIGRTAQEFIQESQYHGWPSFRDTEVVWDNVRILKDGETVSVDGTHLGHNLPDRKGNRYCINLVSIAGQPTSTSA